MTPENIIQRIENHVHSMSERIKSAKASIANMQAILEGVTQERDALESQLDRIKTEWKRNEVAKEE